MLADIDDINTHLPQAKLTATDGNEEVTRFQTDVDRQIKGYLSSVYSAVTLAGWDEPDDTPPMIRSIAGRLIAAFWYAQKLGADGAEWDKSYPQFIYNEAMAILMGIREGTIILPEVDEVSGTQFGPAQFYPNDSAPEPKFTMDMLL